MLCFFSVLILSVLAFDASKDNNETPNLDVTSYENLPNTDNFNETSFIQYFQQSLLNAVNSTDHEFLRLFDSKFEYCFNQNCFQHKLPLRSYLGNWGRLSIPETRQLFINEYYFGNSNRYLYIRCNWNFILRGNKQKVFYEQFAIIYFSTSGTIHHFSGWSNPSIDTYFMNKLSIRPEGYLPASNSKEAEDKFEEEYQRERAAKLKAKREQEENKNEL